MSDQSSVEKTWLPVIGRALAHLCMSSSSLGEKTLAERAKFLEALGLERKDVAEMLATTPASITELLRVHRKKKSRKRPNAKKQ